MASAPEPIISPATPQRIIILGCGRVGSTLARQFSREGHEVTVVDVTSDAFRRLGTKYKGRKVVGTGLDQDTLKKVALEKADIFVAVTQGDNTNIMAAQIARQVFAVPQVFARIYDPIRAQAYRKLGILTLCTTTLAAGLIHGAALGDAQINHWQQDLEAWDQAYLEQNG